VRSLLDPPTTQCNKTYSKSYADWDDISFHQKFIDSPHYPDLLGLLEGLVTGPPSIIHVHFDENSINRIVDGPVAELTTFYAIGEGFEETVEELLSVEKESEGCLGYVRGDVVEEIAVSEGEAKGKGHYVATSWTSLQARLDAAKRDKVKDGFSVVASKVGGYEVHDVKFQ
jgi:quinol monooxygenase YgiN